jgi:LacI family transcriptional regulator
MAPPDDPARRGRKKTHDRATILDVARRAKVSLGTVSYVLTGNRNVSDERRGRVMEAIAELNYVPNLLAQGLRSGQTRLIGISLPNTTSAYFSQLMEYLEGHAARDGFEVVQMLHHGDQTIEQRRLGALLAHRLAGLLMVPAGAPGGALETVVQAGVATVALDRGVGAAEFDTVTVDNHRVTTDVGEQLAARGHRHLLLVVAFPNLSTTRQRIDALRDIAQASGGAVRVSVMERGHDPEDFATRFKAFFAGTARPTAVIASNTLIGVWAIRAIQALGLAWPADLSLVVFDHPEWADLMYPRVAVVEPPTAEMARIAWGLLRERMRRTVGATQRIELQARFLLAPSVGAAPASP